MLWCNLIESDPSNENQRERVRADGCVCVWMCDWERESEKARPRESLRASARETERERESERERERETEKNNFLWIKQIFGYARTDRKTTTKHFLQAVNICMACPQDYEMCLNE